MRKPPGTLGLKKFGPGKFWVEKVWAQNIEKVEEKPKKLKKKYRDKLKQARKSSEDAQAAGYTRFKFFWAGVSFGSKKFGPKIFVFIFLVN